MGWQDVQDLFESWRRAECLSLRLTKDSSGNYKSAKTRDAFIEFEGGFRAAEKHYKVG